MELSIPPLPAGHFFRLRAGGTHVLVLLYKSKGHVEEEVYSEYASPAKQNIESAMLRLASRLTLKLEAEAIASQFKGQKLGYTPAE